MQPSSTSFSFLGLSTWIDTVRRATAHLLWPEPPVGPVYRDAACFGVTCAASVEPSVCSGPHLPTITGSTRVYRAIKPQKLIVTEDVIYTWTRRGRTVSTAVSLDVASDLRLISAFVGNMNCLATPPSQDAGMSGACFAYNALGTGLTWPVVHPSIDVVVCFAIQPTVRYRATPPPGFRHRDLAKIDIHAVLNVFGEALRA